MNSAEVKIVCPNCKSEATFFSIYVGSYKLYPNKNGVIKCTYCGLSKNHTFVSSDYYYKIEIGKRMLVAKDLNHLIVIRDFFQNNGKTYEPDFDFPKNFYVKKHEIIAKINNVLKQKNLN